MWLIVKSLLTFHLICFVLLMLTVLLSSAPDPSES